MPDKIPDISMTDIDLDNAGYTASGKEHYIKTVEDYSKVLFEKSITYGDIDKAQMREVTHDHVKSGAHSIASSFGKPTQPKWMWAIKVGQYVCAVLVGVATNHLDKTIGSIGFVGSFAVGGIFLFVEINNSKS